MDKVEIIITAAIVIIAVAIVVYQFAKLTKNQQVSKIKSWLLWAVSEAEEFLGSGTGALKLRYVYDLFITKFPWVSSLVKFETFSAWVDEALEQMRELINKNNNIAELLGSEVKKNV